MNNKNLLLTLLVDHINNMKNWNRIRFIEESIGKLLFDCNGIKIDEIVIGHA